VTRPLVAATGNHVCDTAAIVAVVTTTTHDVDGHGDEQHQHHDERAEDHQHQAEVGR